MLRYGKPLLGTAILLVALISSAGPSAALEAGDWLLRGRLIGVLPTGDGSGIQSDLTTTSLEAENVVVPEVDVTYMVTDNIGLELIAATSPHKIDAEGALAGLGNVADVWLLPPTLLAQYHFTPKSNLRPYVGAGINFTLTYGEHATGSLEGALGQTDVNLDNSVGFALQAGVDYDLSDRWFLNFDVKYIQMNFDVSLASAGTRRTEDVDVNPVIVGIGLGYRF